MFIDVHTHIYPEKISNKVVDFLQHHYGLPVPYQGTPVEFRHIKKRCHVNAAVYFTAATHPSQVRNANLWAKLNYNHGMIGFGTLHPDDPHVESEIKWLKTMGIKGVKFHPDFQRFFIDDVKALYMYEKIAKDFIVIFHVGDDNSPRKIHYSTPRRLSKVLELFPAMKVIAAHMGGYQMWQDSIRYLCGKNLYFDTSSTAGILPDDTFKFMIREHGYDKILLGSDYPFSDPFTEYQKLARMGLPNQELTAIAGGNAARLLKDIGL
ncbi:amidohydrolase family protein [Desulfotomaculum varum]